MKKVLGSLFFILIALMIFVVVGRNLIIKTVIDRGVTGLTGFPTKVESVQYDFPSTINVKGLTIQNPEGFEAKTFVNIPEIFISLELNQLLRHKILHLPEVRLNIKEVHLEKNAQGVSNVELLSSVGKKSGTQASKPAPASEAKGMPFLLETLHLTIRQVSYKDRSGVIGKVPVGNKIDMDLNVQDEIFKDIRDPKALVNMILVKILNGATIGRLMDIDPQQLVGGTLGTAQNVLRGSMTEAEKAAEKTATALTDNEIAKKVTDNAVTQKTTALLKTSGTEAGQALGSATSTAKNKLNGLLGKAKSLAGESAPADSGTAH